MAWCVVSWLCSRVISRDLVWSRVDRHVFVADSAGAQAWSNSSDSLGCPPWTVCNAGAPKKKRGFRGGDAAASGKKGLATRWGGESAALPDEGGGEQTPGEIGAGSWVDAPEGGERRENNDAVGGLSVCSSTIVRHGSVLDDPDGCGWEEEETAACAGPLSAYAFDAPPEEESCGDVRLPSLDDGGLAVCSSTIVRPVSALDDPDGCGWEEEETAAYAEPSSAYAFDEPPEEESCGGGRLNSLDDPEGDGGDEDENDGRAFQRRKRCRRTEEAVPADVWKRFTPAAVNQEKCRARMWSGGRGGQ